MNAGASENLPNLWPATKVAVGGVVSPEMREGVLQPVLQPG
jgi:hypothetical protein